MNNIQAINLVNQAVADACRKRWYLQKVGDNIFWSEVLRGEFIRESFSNPFIEEENNERN
jgi:hypothetical protein